MTTPLTAPRSHLVRALEADLVGPFRRGLPGPNGEDGAGSTEELELPPSRWYLTGFLAPEAGHEEEEEAAEELAAGDDETEEDTGGSAPDPHSFASLHAKCMIVDHEHALITSANFTDRGQSRSIEVGVLIHDKSYAVALERQWSNLVESGGVVQG